MLWSQLVREDWSNRWTACWTQCFSATGSSITDGSPWRQRIVRERSRPAQPQTDGTATGSVAPTSTATTDRSNWELVEAESERISDHEDGPGASTDGVDAGIRIQIGKCQRRPVPLPFHPSGGGSTLAIAACIGVGTIIALRPRRRRGTESHRTSAGDPARKSLTATFSYVHLSC